MQPQTRNNGAIAQLVEQRTENPCVPGSIPGGTTFTKRKIMKPAEMTVFQRVFSLSTTRRNMQFGAIKNCRFGGFFESHGKTTELYHISLILNNLRDSFLGVKIYICKPS